MLMFMCACMPAAARADPSVAADDAAVAALEREAHAWAVVPHLYWGLWGVIQASDSSPGVGFPR